MTRKIEDSGTSNSRTKNAQNSLPPPFSSYQKKENEDPKNDKKKFENPNIFIKTNPPKFKK
jgi:hypothetical protein